MLGIQNPNNEDSTNDHGTPSRVQLEPKFPMSQTTCVAWPAQALPWFSHRIWSIQDQC